MSRVDATVTAASWRLWAMRLVQASVLCLFGAVVAVGFARLAEKFGIAAPHWGMTGAVLSGAVVFAALIWASLRAPSRLAVAQRIDDGAGLRDSLSTAMSVRSKGDGWSANVVSAAERSADQVKLSTALPWQTPARLSWPLIAAMAVLVLWVVPVPDLFGKRTQAAKLAQDAAEINKTQAEVQKAESRVLEPLKKVAPELASEQEKLLKQDELVAKPKSTEAIRRESVRRLTGMSQKIEQLMAGKDAKAGDRTKDLLRQLRSPTNGPLSEMSKELSKGNFAAAQAEMQKALDSAASGQMSAEAKEQVAEQAKELAKQLETLAKDRKDLENKLAERGLDPKLAGDPAALAEAMKQADSMSQQQKDAMVNAAQAMQGASEAMQQMAQAMQQMAEGMSQGGQQGQQQAQQGAAQAAAAMQQMEGMMNDSQNLQAAMAEAKFQLAQMGQKMEGGQAEGMGACENGLDGQPGDGSGGKPGGNGQFAQGDTSQKGGGQGGPGEGDGGGRGEEQAEEKWQKRKATTQLGGGPIIASTFVEGDSIRNESKASFQAVLEAKTKDAQDAIEANVIDKRFQKAVKHFFGSMQTNKPAAAAAPAGAGPATTPEAKK